MGELAQETGLSIEDTQDALYELSDFVGMSSERGKVSQKHVFAKGTCLLNSTVIGNREFCRRRAATRRRPRKRSRISICSRRGADRYGWKPRRLNPAFLLERELIHDLRAMGTHPYAVVEIVRNDQTRRFVKSRT